MTADRTPRAPGTAKVRAFWEAHPVAAAAIEAAPGTPAFFLEFDRLRQEIEPDGLQAEIYGYAAFRSRAVLEVGCGNGYLLSRYARHGARTCGIDLTWTGVALSRERFRLAGLAGRLAQADAERLPFADACFDRVVSAGVLHHVPDVGAAVAEIHRVLRPGGSVVLMLYHRNSLHYRVLYPLYGLLHPAFRGKTPAAIAREIDGFGNPIGGTYTRGEMRALLHAFREVRLRVGSLALRGASRIPGARAVLDLLAPRLGWFLYAVGVK
jgi:SAM-dependent methyltransferase